MDPARHRHAHRRRLGLTGLELPARGHLRARARTVGAFGFVETIAAFPLTPEITVQQPIGTRLLADLATVTFGQPPQTSP